ncbi:TPA: hypothetical protein ACH3X3_005454 [Trebouxia sp. C0006]
MVLNCHRHLLCLDVTFQFPSCSNLLFSQLCATWALQTNGPLHGLFDCLLSCPQEQTQFMHSQCWQLKYLQVGFDVMQHPITAQHRCGQMCIILRSAVLVVTATSHIKAFTFHKIVCSNVLAD